jgi:lipopolysaccharide export system permease protein
VIAILDRHIGRSLLVATLLVTGVLLALFVFISVVDVLPDYGKGTFGVYELLRYVVLSQPRKLYEAFPVAVLVGTLLGLSTLAINAELTAMRAAGVSRARIVMSAMKTGLLLMLLAVAMGEYVVPTVETQAQTGRARALATGFQQKGSGLWLRDGTRFVSLGEVLPDLSLLRIAIYEFGPDRRLLRLTSADRAVYDDGRWRLEGVHRTRLGEDRVEAETASEERWVARLTPEVVAVYTVKPEALSIAQLSAYIRHLEANGQETGRYRLTMWQKILMPLATMIMVLLATPFVFREARSGGLAQRVFAGVMIGLAFVVLHRSAGYLGVIYGVPPILGAALPLVLFLALAGVLLRRS